MVWRLGKGATAGPAECTFVDRCDLIGPQWWAWEGGVLGALISATRS
jgi:hypothetical protein